VTERGSGRSVQSGYQVAVAVCWASLSTAVVACLPCAQCRQESEKDKTRQDKTGQDRKGPEMIQKGLGVPVLQAGCSERFLFARVVLFRQCRSLPVGGQRKKLAGQF
jgi:hypothetical protein